MARETTEPNSVEAKVRGFVVESFLFGQGGDELGSADSFIEKGILDSTGVLELATFVEESWSIKISDEELIPENMDSIDNLVRFIRSKVAAGD